MNLEHLKTALGQVVKCVESSSSLMSLEVLSVNHVPQGREPMKIGLDVVNLLIDFSPLADFPLSPQILDFKFVLNKTKSR